MSLSETSGLAPQVEQLRDQVEAGLAQLEAQGARHFDDAACDCVRGLLTAAETLSGGAGQRLVQRAAHHLQGLETQLAHARTRATGALEKADDVGGARPWLEQQIARGETSRALRGLRRLRARPRRVDAPYPEDGEGQHESRRLRCAEVYEDSLAELVASFALARAVDDVPEGAGPYNPLRIATEVLDGMRAISPQYLTVQVNRLEELASLLTLPDLPDAPAPEAGPPKGKALPRSRQRGRPGRGRGR